MPTPVGHSLAALAIHLASGKKITHSKSLTLALLIVIASVPDLDFVPGYLAGDPRLYHWGATHSFSAALLAGLLAGGIARWLTGRFAVAFALTSAVYASHIALDLLLGYGAPAMGIQVFWPFSRQIWMAPVHVFMMFPSSIEEHGPIAVLFSREIFPVIAHELMILVPVVLAGWAGSTLLRKRTNARPQVTAHESQALGALDVFVTGKEKLSIAENTERQRAAEN